MPRLITSIKGKEVIKQRLKRIANLLETPEAQSALRRVQARAVLYWAGNVYTRYNSRTSLGLSTSGQLGNAVQVSTKPNWSIDIGMKRLYHTTNKGDTYEYSQYLQRDILPSVGVYLPKFDARVPRGVHPGTNNLFERWTPWMDEYVGDITANIKHQVAMLTKQVVST